MKTCKYLTTLLVILNFNCSNPDFEGSDTIITVTRDLSEFTKVKAQNDLDVSITQGDEQRVDVVVNDNLQNNLRTEVSNGTLNISLADGSYDNASFTVNIQIPNLERLQLNDNTRGVVNFVTEQIEFEIKGSSELELYGGAEILNTILRDAGKLHGFSFSTHVLNTISRDASELRITCIEDLNGTIAQASKVYYQGQPVVNVQTSEAGQLINSN
ncbi:GIN domain-containing protein [Winogradskyella sp.]|uniref:GIN domain-containing protein n=1 Tax=Winogradskyella sp. TaxID=1883156 RepID=UPI003BA98144